MLSVENLPRESYIENKSRLAAENYRLWELGVLALSPSQLAQGLAAKESLNIAVAVEMATTPVQFEARLALSGV